MEEWPWGLQEAPPLHGWGVFHSADFACNAPYTPELKHRQCVGSAPPVGTGLAWDPAQGMVGPQTGSERAAGEGSRNGTRAMGPSPVQEGGSGVGVWEACRPNQRVWSMKSEICFARDDQVLGVSEP